MPCRAGRDPSRRADFCRPRPRRRPGGLRLRGADHPRPRRHRPPPRPLPELCRRAGAARREPPAERRGGGVARRRRPGGAPLPAALPAGGAGGPAGAAVALGGAGGGADRAGRRRRLDVELAAGPVAGRAGRHRAPGHRDHRRAAGRPRAPGRRAECDGGRGRRPGGPPRGRAGRPRSGRGGRRSAPAGAGAPPQHPGDRPLPDRRRGARCRPGAGRQDAARRPGHPDPQRHPPPGVPRLRAASARRPRRRDPAPAGPAARRRDRLVHGLAADRAPRCRRGDGRGRRRPRRKATPIASYPVEVSR